MAPATALQHHVKNFGHTAFKAVRKTAAFVDKAAHVAHSSLSNLTPDARYAIGNAIHHYGGTEPLRYANRAARAVERYEDIRERLGGAR